MGKLCGVKTKNGPCTMQEGHEAEWHRHIPVESHIEWAIYKSTGIGLIGSGLTSGKGKANLYSEISIQMGTHDELIIAIKRVKGR